MRRAFRTMMLLIAALCLALPLASGTHARGAWEPASKPCPSKMVLEACFLDALSDWTVPRSGASIDGPCFGKAIDAESSAPEAPSACGAFTFEIADASWSSRSLPTPTPPPRS